MSEAVRAALDAARELAADAHRAGNGAPERSHADAVDGVLVELFETACADHGSQGLALFALGGYGRRELAPFSDLDLLLVHRGRDEATVESVNRDLMYPLWDAGRDVGNRVRAADDVVRSLDRVDESTAALDARLLAGDRGLAMDVTTSVLRRLQRGRAGFVRSLRSETESRHARHGHAGHLLEPDIRDSAGGLRDLQTLGWAAAVLPGGDGLDPLVEAGALADADRRALDAARVFCWRVRFASHLLAGRRQDRLYLADQDRLAASLGYADGEGMRAGDRLMRELHRHAREVDAIVGAAWERLTHRQGRFFRATTRSLGEGCVLQHGCLEVVAAPAPVDEPAGWMRAFELAAEHDVAVGRASVARLRHSLGDADVAWTPSALEVFGELLRSGPRATAALEAVDGAGLLGALLPPWRDLRGLPQRDIYHRYTVDVHLFRTVAELAASRSDDEPAVQHAWARVPDGDALLLAALFHDVGKGRGGDHSVIGEEIARRCLERMGIDERRAGTIAWCVREHLTLPEAATHRDLNDERTVADMVAVAGDPERLAMLYLLARADAIATGPQAWSTFRASLMRELYSRAMAAMESPDRSRDRHGARVEQVLAATSLAPDEARRAVESLPNIWLEVSTPEDAARQLEVFVEPLASDEVRLRVEPGPAADRVIVVAHDRPALFATVCGVLALRGIDVHRAEAYTSDSGIALDVFTTTGTHGPTPPERWERVRRDLHAALSGTLDLEDALRRRRRQARPVRRPSVREPDAVFVDNAASGTHTVIEVRAGDRIGLLGTVASALTRAGCDIGVVRAATYGSRVVDVFYVRDAAGERISDPSRVSELKALLLAAVQGPDRA